MAWDIFHLKELIYLLKFNPSFNLNPDINIPVFYSLDKRLNEIRHFYQINAVAINRITKQLKFFPYIQPNEIDERISKYFKKEFYDKRMERKHFINLDKLIENLENEIDTLS